MKKYKLLSSMVAAGSIAIAVSAIATDASAQKTTIQTKAFVCGTSNGAPATIAQTNRGDVPVIRWTSDRFREAGYSPQRRCLEVSARFHQYFRNQKLNYLTTGIMNNQQVVCVANGEGGNCTGLLFTLKPGSEPNQVLKNLLAVRVRASGPLNESASRVYIDMSEYLQQAAVEDPQNSQSDNPVW
ncbi:MAG: COP23 domain-containing protein [Microcoleus sp.]|uniref:COP23 domain-containing protein n=1 Tax=unclassified Microcoleus TaxID=2642155 RepID=UPI001D158E03|nr:COP23 domain-containing protein [Microcoleus sp. LEGE 07076]